MTVRSGCALSIVFALSTLLAGCSGVAGPSEQSTAATSEQQALAEAAYVRAGQARMRGDAAGAAGYFRDAAELGHADAAYELGLAYATGDGVPENHDLSAYWINHAADRGSPGAQFLVGASLYGGIGVERDAPRGLAFLRAAAAQGHPKAQFMLGQAYADGVGVPANPQWAAHWYGKAAHAGHAQAQYALGVMFASGFGVPKSPRRAYRWFSLAALSGDGDAARLRDRMASLIDPDTRAAIDLRNAGFVARESRGYDDPPTVMYVQMRLRALGYDVGPVDGIAGPRTRSAIEAYQRAQRTTADGKLTRSLVDDLLKSSAAGGA